MAAGANECGGGNAQVSGDAGGFGVGEPDDGRGGVEAATLAAFRALETHAHALAPATKTLYTMLNAVEL